MIEQDKKRKRAFLILAADELSRNLIFLCFIVLIVRSFLSFFLSRICLSERYWG